MPRRRIILVSDADIEESTETPNSLEKKSRLDVAFPPITSPVHCLIDDVLVVIFEELNFRDRIKVERVCKRWRHVAYNKSWTSFKQFSISNLTEICKQLKSNDIALKRFTKNFFPYGPYISFLTPFQFTCLFNRCAPYIEELSFDSLSFFYPNLWSEFVEFTEECKTRSKEAISTNICQKRPKFVFPNLRHLNLSGLQLITNDLKNIAKAFPSLFSFEVTELAKESFPGLIHLLATCDHLEFLKITECHKPCRNLKFTILPKELKYLELDCSVNVVSLLDQGITNCPKLQSIELDMSAGLKQDFFSGVCWYTNLQYLLLHLSHEKEIYFLKTIKSLPNLRALQIYGYRSEESKFPEAISYIEKLEHLNLAVLAATEELECLLKLANLKSLSIYFKQTDTGNSHAFTYFDQFFQRLSTKKILQHFDTNATMSIKSICAAIADCKDLRFVSWKTTILDHVSLFDALEQVHAGEARPIHSADPRILHIYLKKAVYKNIPENCWVKFCKNLQTSKVMNDIRLTALSSRPYFASCSYKDE
uniref:F-box domain-containing protein n=1 Tax=Ditylenchus dipsaci TaxID=166011 RepID=A0A915E6C6_9BILA